MTWMCLKLCELIERCKNSQIILILYSLLQPIKAFINIRIYSVNEMEVESCRAEHIGQLKFPLNQPNSLDVVNENNGMFGKQCARILMGLFLMCPMWLGAVNSDEWQIEQIQVEDGLPDSTVYSLVQDELGFIWFGTTNGLARYDGYDFKYLTHDETDQNTISNDNAGNIFIGSDNKLWVGTFGGGVNAITLNNNTVTRFPYSTQVEENRVSENVQTFFEDDTGLIWIGAATGLYSYNGHVFKRYGLQADSSEHSSYTRVWDILQAGPHKLWVATSDGLYQFDTHTQQFKHFELPAPLVFDITSNQFRTLYQLGGEIWIGSSSGLYSFNPTTEEFAFYNDSQNSIKVNDLISIEESRLLVASMSGLLEFDVKRRSFNKNEKGMLWQSMPHVDVRNMLLDKTGILWLASRDSGVFKINMAGGMFVHQTNLLPLSHQNEKVNQIWSIGFDGNQLLLGTSDGIIRKEKDKEYQQIKTSTQHNFPNIIRDMEPSSRGGFWIGSNQGLMLMKSTDLIEEILTPFELAGIDPTDVFSVAESNSGTVWLALYNLGVLRWSPQESTAELIQNTGNMSLIDTNLSHIFVDSDENVWLASNLVGLFKLTDADKQWQQFNHKYNDTRSISSNRIKDIFEDSNGRLWVATARGLDLFRPKQQDFKRYDQKDGLLDDNITLILEDSMQNLWLGYKHGLSKFKPEDDLVNSYMVNAAIKNDGLVTRSGAISNHDIIYLGSANGFYTFDPKNLNITHQTEPTMLLTTVKVDNQLLPFENSAIDQRQFSLQHDDNAILFKFAVLDYKTSKQIQYMYRLPGFHENWQDITDSRSVELKNLNPGQYQLQVKALNNDGRWREQSMLLDLRVMPAWWDKAWVKTLFLVAFIFLVVGIHQQRTRKFRRQNLQLENEVNRRTTELQELNDKLAAAANTDFLTGLPNRMSFINDIESISQQQAINGCIAMADIDYFKKINDQYGHSAGDVILKKIAGLMRSLIRSEDLIARWGGEEFIFFFKDKDLTVTMELMERLRKTIAAQPVEYHSETIQVTMTSGICELARDGKLLDAINAADEALYKGKALGRNRVILATELKGQ